MQGILGLPLVRSKTLRIIKCKGINISESAIRFTPHSDLEIAVFG